jgi:hypothetical protein
VETFKHKKIRKCAVQQKKILCFQLVTIVHANEPIRTLVLVRLRKEWQRSAHGKARSRGLEIHHDAPIWKRSF